MTLPEAAGAGADPAGAALDLADWRRRVASLYAEIRGLAVRDPQAAWEQWRAVREELYRGHPQSPVPSGGRPAFRARYWPYDPAFRFEFDLDVANASANEGSVPALPMSTGTSLSFSRIGRLTIPFPSGARTLDLFWMAGYTGGLFLPFRDATNGRETYGAGRYLLDTAKGADLGAGPMGGLVLDFNFAFQPSCAFDPRWSCPLAPPENRLDFAVAAGERID